MKNQAGYTLIELLIVISIIVGLAAFSIPAYKQFTIPQALKNATSQLKSDLRIIHSNASNGVKNLAGNRVSWVMRVVGGQSYYELSGCSKTELFSSCKDSNHNYQKKQIGRNFKIYPCNLPCTDLSGITGITLYFIPIDGTIEMYNNVDTVAPGGTGNTILSYTKMSFLIKSLEDTTKTSIITTNLEGSVTGK